MHFALSNLKRKINVEGQHVYCFSHVEDSITKFKLNWLPVAPFLVYIYGIHLTFGKPFARTQYNVLIFLNRFCEKHGSADRINNCNLSVPIRNEQALERPLILNTCGKRYMRSDTILRTFYLGSLRTQRL